MLHGSLWKGPGQYTSAGAAINASKVVTDRSMNWRLASSTHPELRRTTRCDLFDLTPFYMVFSLYILRIQNHCFLFVVTIVFFLDLMTNLLNCHFQVELSGCSDIFCGSIVHRARYPVSIIEINKDIEHSCCSNLQLLHHLLV